MLQLALPAHLLGAHSYISMWACCNESDVGIDVDSDFIIVVEQCCLKNKAERCQKQNEKARKVDEFFL